MMKFSLLLLSIFFATLLVSTRTFIEIVNCNPERHLSGQTCARAFGHVREDVRVHLIGKVTGNLANGGRFQPRK